MSSNVEVVGRSLCCSLKMSFSFNEADTCRTEGINSCLGAAAWSCLSGPLHGVLLVGVFVNLSIITECSSGLTLGMIALSWDPGSAGVEDADVWEHLYVLLPSWRNRRGLTGTNRSTCLIAGLNFYVLHRRLSVVHTELSLDSASLQFASLKGKRSRSKCKLHPGAPDAGVCFWAAVKDELILNPISAIISSFSQSIFL